MMHRLRALKIDCSLTPGENRWHPHSFEHSLVSHSLETSNPRSLPMALALLWKQHSFFLKPKKFENPENHKKRRKSDKTHKTAMRSFRQPTVMSGSEDTLSVKARRRQQTSPTTTIDPAASTIEVNSSRPLTPASPSNERKSTACHRSPTSADNITRAAKTPTKRPLR